MILELDLEGQTYWNARKLAFNKLEEEAPDAIIGDVMLGVGEVLANCYRRGNDLEVEVNFGYDISSFAFIVTVTADSHRKHWERISKLLYDCHRRRCCGMSIEHGRGLDIVSCVADKVILDEDGNMRLYFACVLPDYDCSRGPLDRGNSLFTIDNLYPKL